MPNRGPDFRKFVLNCVESRGTGTDWGFDDALEANNLSAAKTAAGGSMSLGHEPPEAVDLREEWWTIRDQGESGACVGFAAADGVLRWCYVKKGLMQETERPSPRFIWMANKETDDFTRYPTTFLEPAGTSTKLALGVAQRYGCVPETMLPMDGQLSPLRPSVFFAIAAQFRINSYYNLGIGLNPWRTWIATNGPILTRLWVDETWKNATDTDGVLEKYSVTDRPYGGHAVCLVGYNSTHFIVRNSWGTDWGDGGFAYASNEYAEKAFTETYGAVI